MCREINLFFFHRFLLFGQWYFCCSRHRHIAAMVFCVRLEHTAIVCLREQRRIAHIMFVSDSTQEVEEKKTDNFKITLHTFHLFFVCVSFHFPGVCCVRAYVLCVCCRWWSKKATKKSGVLCALLPRYEHVAWASANRSPSKSRNGLHNLFI